MAQVKQKLPPITLRSNLREDVQDQMDVLRNAIELELGRIAKKLKLGDANAVVAGPIGQRGEQGEQGIPGPPGGITNPITSNLVPDAACLRDLGSMLFPWNKLWICDTTIEFETGSLSIAPSADRPGERGLYFQDNLGSDPVELTPKPKAVDVTIDDVGNFYISTNVEDALQEIFSAVSNAGVYRNAQQLTYLGFGEYQTPEDFSTTTLKVYRNGQLIDFTGVNRINITGVDKFKFNLAGTIDSTTMVTCSYNIVY